MTKRHTVQKQIILDALRAVSTHPTVEELHADIARTHASISKSTVYRNLHQLVESGDALRIPVANDATRFDGDLHPHHHFICDNCQQMFDLFVANPAGVHLSVTNGLHPHNHHIDRSMTLFYGVCEACAQK